MSYIFNEGNGKTRVKESTNIEAIKKFVAFVKNKDKRKKAER